MKFFLNARFQSLAATAALMMFATSVAQADVCSDPCTTYANQAKASAEASFIAQAPTTCAPAMAGGGQSAYDACVAAVTASAPAQAAQVYTYVYNSCMASCRRY